jgi:hypothetical protein
MMAFRRLHILILVFLASSLMASRLSGQNANLYGVVVDSLTRQRISFANVMVMGTNRGATANDVGFYLIPTLSPGSYDLAVSAVGYTRVVKSVVIKENQSVEVNFRMPPTDIESQEVVVTGARRRKESEISTSVHVLEKQDLKFVPVTAQQDLLQSIKILPGFVSTSDVSSKFFVRGGAGDQNLFLLDGIRVYSPFHALGLFSVFDPDIVDNAEVYTGAFPPGFGGALSSVVNITSRQGRADRFSGKGNINFLSGGIAVEGPAFGRSSWFVNARKSMFPKTFSNILGQNAPVSFYDAVAKFSLQPEGVQKVDITYLSSHDAIQFDSPDEPAYAWENSGFAVSSSALPIERLFVRLLIYGSNFSASRDPKESKIITAASTSVKEGGLRLALTYYTGSQDYAFFGFDFRFPTLKYSFVNKLGYPQQIGTSLPEVTSWAQYRVNLDGLQVDAGIHLEVGSLFEGGDAVNEIQPRINVSYLLAGNWRAKASFGRFTQRTLTVGNEDDVVSLFDAWIRVPTGLPSERADHYVLGLAGNFTDAISLNLETYYKHYGSLVVYNRDKTVTTDPDYIQGRGKSYGVELMMRSRAAFVDLYGAYSLSWAEVNNGGFLYYPRYDRRHHLNLMGVIQPLTGLSFTLRWEYGSGFPFTQTIGYMDRLTLDGALPGPFETETGVPFLMLGAKNAARLPNYHRLDFGTSYNMTLLGFEVSIGADIMNLYDNKNIFYFDRSTGQRVNMLSFYPSASLIVKY